MMTQEILDTFLSTVNQSGRYICPVCTPERKKKTERTLSVTIENEGTVYMCHHCEVSGNHKQKDNYRPVVTAISIPKKPNAEELDGVSSYLEGRGINYERLSQGKSFLERMETLRPEKFRQSALSTGTKRRSNGGQFTTNGSLKTVLREYFGALTKLEKIRTSTR